jgi:hypothetical protein
VPEVLCRPGQVPASVLRQSGKSEQHRRARPLILIVERDKFIATSHESMILDAARLRVSREVAERPQSRCGDLTKKLFVREIPFLAVSGYPADTPGVNRIFRSVPWLEKPVTPAGVQLALRSIL